MTGDQLYDLLKTYSGGIIAIISMITSAVFQHLFKKYMGNIKITVSSAKYRYEKYINGNLTSTKKIDEALNAIVICQIDMYNSKDIPISLRDIHIEIGEKRKDPTYYFGIKDCKKIKTINIPAKNMVDYSFDFKVSKDEFQGDIYFVAEKEDGKQIKKEIIVKFQDL